MSGDVAGRASSARLLQQASRTEVASSHVPVLSQPEVVIDAIHKAAAAARNG